MKEEIQNRLAALRDEYEKGRERLRELQRQQSQIEETLLRIEGAMTVLREFLPPPTGQSHDTPPTVATRC
jgi:predicted nuclease with TOPRIM domain